MEIILTIIGGLVVSLVAGIDYPYENWADIIRKHKPSRRIEIVHTPRGKAKLPPIQIGRPRKLRLTKQMPPITERGNFPL